MAAIKQFEDLEIWKLARALAQRVFHLITNSPGLSKDFALKDQMNRSSGSIMDNIAEGFGRNSRNEFVNFLSYSQGSGSELKSQLYRAVDREYISDDSFKEVYGQTDKIAAKIGAFIKYLNSCSVRGAKFKGRTKQ